MAQNWYGAGELWKKDVKSVRAGAETRKEFYGDKALRKVGSKLLGDVSGFSTDDLVTKLKEHAEITKDEKILDGKWDPEKVGSKRYISDILKDFFEKKCGSKRGTADALIALKFLNAEIENIDLIRAGETVEIENGILTVKSGGEVVARGAILNRSKLPAGSPEALARSGAVRKKTRAALAGVKAAVAATMAPRGQTGAPIAPELREPAVVPPAPPAAPPAGPVVPAVAPAAASPQPVPPAVPPAASPRSVVTPPAPPASPLATAPAAPAATPAAGPAAIPPPKPAAAPAAPAAVPSAPSPGLAAPIPPLPAAVPAAAPRQVPAAPTIAPPGAPAVAPAPEKSPEEILADREKEVAGLKVKGYAIEKSKTPDPHNFYSAIFEVRPGKKREVVATIGVVKDSPENIHVHVKRPVFEKPGTQEDDIAGNFTDLADLAEKLPKLINPPEAEQKEKIEKRRGEVEKALKTQKDLKILAHEIKLVEDKGPNKKLAYFKMRLEGASGPAVDVGFVGIYKENPTDLVLEKLDHKRVGVFQPANMLADAAANSENFTWGGGTMAPGAVPPDALPGGPSTVRPGPENDPVKLTTLVDNLTRDRKWDDVLLTAHLILTNPKSNADQKANAELKSIDAYRAQGKVDLAITAYKNYLRLKPRDVAKSLEGGRYAFENKKYNQVIDIGLKADLTIDTKERKEFFELAGDATFELKNYEGAKFYWESARGLYAPGDANVGRIDEKLKKLPEKTK